MRMLIWKEFRLCWPILLVGAVLLIAPYAIAWVCMSHEEPLEEFELAILVMVLALASLSVSVLTLALLGGNAIAGERVDRSSEFLAIQPISRAKILLSKLTWPMIAAVVIWGSNLLVLCVLANHHWDVQNSDIQHVWERAEIVAVISLVTFSVAWLFSTLQNSPTFAVLGGVATPLAIAVCLWAIDWLSAGEAFIGPGAELAAYRTVCITLATVSLIGGCWYYLRRVEP